MSFRVRMRGEGNNFRERENRLTEWREKDEQILKTLNLVYQIALTS